jgi:hypothetical protein
MSTRIASRQSAAWTVTGRIGAGYGIGSAGNQVHGQFRFFHFAVTTDCKSATIKNVANWQRFRHTHSNLAEGIPSLSTAVAGLCIICVWPSSKWHFGCILGGVLFGIALQTKLLPGILLSLAVLILWRRNQGKVLISSLAFGIALIATFFAIDLLIDKGAYLVHFNQSWSSHFGAPKSFDFGSANDHPFDFRVVLNNWDTSVPAVLGAIILMRRLLPLTLGMLPLAWLVLSFTVFTLHRPWWAYYYIHTAIPLCWCAALGMATCAQWAYQSRNNALLPLLSLFILGALFWTSARVYLQVIGIRNSPQLDSEPVLQFIVRLRPFTRWLYADKSIYSFHSDIPMPPQLAVVSLKRFWSGEITIEGLVSEISAAKPEMILLPNDGLEVPFQALLQNDYSLIFVDGEHRLFAQKIIALKALP